jgi:hypothetical protein
MAERPEAPDDNPFRMNSPRNVLSRAKERLRLVRYWLIRHEEVAQETKPPLNGKDPSGK